MTTRTQDKNPSMKSFARAIITCASVLIVLALSAHGASAASPLGTTFTYQGRLTQSGIPINGDADFQMSLWDGPGAGSAQVTPILPATATVVDGTVAVDLNFGVRVFNGQERWLQIAVRFPAGAGSFTTLTPRQRINSAPYALALPGLYTLMSEFSPNIVGGFSGNSVPNTDQVIGATICGGGIDGFVNSVTADFGTVCGGEGNAAGYHCFVGGGDVNVASDAGAAGGNTTVGGGSHNTANAYAATIAGGSTNMASGLFTSVGGGANNSAGGIGSTIAGGFTNIVSTDYSVIAGGKNNHASGLVSSVGGGEQNTASFTHAAVGGGFGNTASGDGSTVAGGVNNSAGGAGATVPGGSTCAAAGSYSFATGRRAKANHNGSFVWGDSTNADVSSLATNTFTARASNGFIFYTNSSLTSGAAMGAGAGAWTSLSDRNRKRDLRPVDALDVLARVVALPISSWSYNSQDPSIRHIGPMAQDFNPAFGVGEFENGITTIDADGVALAAIQGLHRTLTDEVSRLRETTAAQAAELASVKAQLDELRVAVAAIARTGRTTASNEE